jgi:hypothetical protein
MKPFFIKAASFGKILVVSFGRIVKFGRKTKDLAV